MFRDVQTLPPVTPPPVAEGGDVTAISSGWRLGLRSFAENKLAVVGVGLLLARVDVGKEIVVGALASLWTSLRNAKREGQ